MHFSLSLFKIKETNAHALNISFNKKKKQDKKEKFQKIKNKNASLKRAC